MWFASPGCGSLLVVVSCIKGAFGVAFGDRTSSTLDTPHHDQGKIAAVPEPLPSTTTVQGIPVPKAAGYRFRGGARFRAFAGWWFAECEDSVSDCDHQVVGKRLPTTWWSHSAGCASRQDHMGGLTPQTVGCHPVYRQTTRHIRGQPLNLWVVHRRLSTHREPAYQLVESAHHQTKHTATPVPDSRLSDR